MFRVILKQTDRSRKLYFHEKVAEKLVTRKNVFVLDERCSETVSEINFTWWNESKQECVKRDDFKRRPLLFISWIACVLSCAVALVLSDCLRPHRLSPTRLLCPCDAPDRNTGVGCCVLLRDLLNGDWTHSSAYVLALAGGFLTSSATWEAQFMD